MKVIFLFLIVMILFNLNSISQKVYKPVDSVLSMAVDSIVGSSHKWIIEATPMILDKEWIFASSDGEEMASYISNKNILKDRKINNDIYYKIWVKEFYLKWEYQGKLQKDVYALERMYIDCKNMMYKTTRVIYYSHDDKVIYNLEREGESETKWKEPIINSIGEAILKKGCALAKINFNIK